MAEKVRKVSDAQLAEALRNSGGVMAEAARLISESMDIPYSRQAVAERVKGSSVLREAVEAGRDELVDVAECKLRKMLDDGNEKAVFFVLKTRGRRRGFDENDDRDNPDMDRLRPVDELLARSIL